MTTCPTCHNGFAACDCHRRPQERPELIPYRDLEGECKRLAEQNAKLKAALGDAYLCISHYQVCGYAHPEEGPKFKKIHELLQDEPWLKACCAEARKGQFND
jgi:hypothetical protein